jgi:hypothetical protein
VGDNIVPNTAPFSLSLSISRALSFSLSLPPFLFLSVLAVYAVPVRRAAALRNSVLCLPTDIPSRLLLPHSNEPPPTTHLAVLSPVCCPDFTPGGC